MKAIDGLDRCVNWCTEHGIKVEFKRVKGGGSILENHEVKYPYRRTSAEIEISAHALPENQLHCLLHECGHGLISGLKKHQRYGMGHVNLDANVRKTLRHKYDVLDEELEAWYRGEKLAKRLKIKLNREKFHATRLFRLKSYVNWIAIPNEFEWES